MLHLWEKPKNIQTQQYYSITLFLFWKRNILNFLLKHQYLNNSPFIFYDIFSLILWNKAKICYTSLERSCNILLLDYLLDILKNGEKIDVELKTAKNKLPSTLFETVCAFLNRSGGHIFLGVDDSKKIVGINPDKVADLRKDFASLCNNPQKIFPTIKLLIKEYEDEDKSILYINVYESSEVHRTNNKIFDRNEDGDYDITNNTSLISQMYVRKSSSYAENEIFEYATLNDLRRDVIAKARQMAVNKDTNHPWQYMDDLALLRSPRFMKKIIILIRKV